MAHLTFIKSIMTVWKASFQKSKPKEILYRNHKYFDISTFKNVLRLKLESFEQLFLEVLNKRERKKKFRRANHVPCLTKSLRKDIILKIGPLKIKLNIRDKIIFVVNVIKRNGKNSAQTYN